MDYEVGLEFVTKTFIPQDSKEDIIFVTEHELILLDELLEEGPLCSPWLEGAEDFS